MDLVLSLDCTKSAGSDGISPKLLRLAGNMIVPSLTKLFNKSFGSEKVPKLWKEANITPLHKKGNKDDADLLENFQLDVARIVCGARKGTCHDAISEELGWESLKSRRLASKDKHFTKICNKSAPQYLCELLPTTVGEHSQRSLRNENDLKEMKGRTETFRGSFIPDALKRCNYNQKGNVINRNDYVVVEMNRKL